MLLIESKLTSGKNSNNGSFDSFTVSSISKKGISLEKSNNGSSRFPGAQFSLDLVLFEIDYRQELVYPGVPSGTLYFLCEIDHIAITPSNVDFTER